MALISFQVPVVCHLKHVSKGDTLKVTWKYVERQFEVQEIPIFEAPTAVSYKEKYDYLIRHQRSSGRYWERNIEQPEVIDEITIAELWDSYGLDFSRWHANLIDIVADDQGIDFGEYPEWSYEETLKPLRSTDISASLLQQQLDSFASWLTYCCIIDGSFYLAVPEPVAMINELWEQPHPDLNPFGWFANPTATVLMAFSMANWDRAAQCINDIGLRVGRSHRFIEMRELHRDEFNPVDPKILKTSFLNAFSTLFLTEQHGGNPEPKFPLVADLDGADQRWLKEFQACIYPDNWEISEERVDKNVNAILALEISPKLRAFAETSREFGIIRQAFIEEMADGGKTRKPAVIAAE